MKKVFHWIWQKAANFFKWIWRECRNWQTVLLLLFVCIVIGSPVWICGLLWVLFHWQWAFIAFAALLAFWCLPGMPYFALCVSITLIIKGIFGKYKQKRLNKKKLAIDNAEVLEPLEGAEKEGNKEDDKKDNDKE